MRGRRPSVPKLSDDKPRMTATAIGDDSRLEMIHPAEERTSRICDDASCEPAFIKIG
jgi:hypothetical protein